MITEVDSDVHNYYDLDVENGVSYSYYIIGLNDQDQAVIESEIIKL